MALSPFAFVRGKEDGSVILCPSLSSAGRRACVGFAKGRQAVSEGICSIKGKILTAPR